MRWSATTSAAAPIPSSSATAASAGDINKNSNYTNGEQNRGANAAYIDLDRVLPNGQPNSHYLQAYAATIRGSRGQADSLLRPQHAHDDDRHATPRTRAADRLDGWNYSARFELFQRELDLNFTYYTSEEINNLHTVGGFPFNMLLQATPMGSTADLNKRGVPVFVAGSDKQDRQARGYEIELTANMIKGLRMMGSVSLPNVFGANAYQLTRAYVQKNAENFKLIVQDTGARITRRRTRPRKIRPCRPTNVHRISPRRSMPTTPSSRATTT